MAVQQEYTREEVARHNTDKSLWIIVDSEVFDLTKFVDMHPGGAGVILEVAGKDATGMYSLPGKLFTFRLRTQIHVHCFALRSKKLDPKGLVPICPVFLQLGIILIMISFFCSPLFANCR